MRVIAAWIAVLTIAGVSALRANPTASTSATPQGFKAPLTGFIDRNGTPQLSWMTGEVVNVRWDQLESAAGAPLTANNPIDQATAAVRAWNVSHSVQRGLKIRLFVGSSSPVGSKLSWVQSLGGSPVTVSGAQGQNCQVGHFWTPVFASAYQTLETDLAAAYDAVPEIREVTLSMAALCYSEPFLHYDWSALAAAGDTTALDQASYATMIAAHKVWKHTLQDLSFNPYTGTGGEAFTEAEIAAFRATFGSQGVLENNSIRSTSLGSTYDAMYAAIKAAGGPISFQTATPNSIGDPAATFALAAGYGAESVELPSGYQSYPANVLATGQAELLANAAPQPTPTPSPTPAPTPQPINNVPCAVTLPAGTEVGTCSGTFLPAGQGMAFVGKSALATGHIITHGTRFGNVTNFSVVNFQFAPGDTCKP